MLKKVISFGLWGDAERYLPGAEANVLLARRFYPGWECWFWVDQTVSVKFLNRLRNQSNCRILYMDSTKTKIDRLIWRFLTAKFCDVGIVLIRDADSRLSEREQHAVAAWLEAGTGFHVMRDHPLHNVPILGGMWGYHAKHLRHIRTLIDDYYQTGRHHKVSWGVDQDFLSHSVWPIAKTDCTIHDSFHSDNPFPYGRRDELNFVGRPLFPDHVDWDELTPRLNEQECIRKSSSTVKNNITAQRELSIVFKRGMFGMPLDLDRFQVPGVKFDEGEEMVLNADVVVLHVPEWESGVGKGMEKRPGQLWVAWSSESDINYPRINDSIFDLKMTYQRNADVWTPYCADYGENLLNELKKPSPPKVEGCVIASFISSSDNKSGREEYLQELSRHIEIHHYGKFLNNRLLEEDHGWNTKIDVFRQYQFAIAFENSISTDYITEKYYDPLLVGTIPIYLGAPNIDDYAPGYNCHINVNDFSDPASLAAYLTEVSQNDALLQRHLAWKTEPLRAGFTQQILSLAESEHAFVRLAEQVKQHFAVTAGLVPEKDQAWEINTSDDGYLLVNNELDIQTAINRAAGVIYELCDGMNTVAMIEETLIAAFPGDSDQIGKDVIAALHLMNDQHVIHFINAD